MMKTGVEVAFAAANEAGGVRGRKLQLVALDDGYEPARTAGVMKELAEQRHVFGFIGNVGTPTAVVAVPYAVEHRMLFFGPFTGAMILRKDPPDRYVFNYRASYVEETAAIVRHFVDVKRIKPHDIAVFAQTAGGTQQATLTPEESAWEQRYRAIADRVTATGVERWQHAVVATVRRRAQLGEREDRAREPRERDRRA